MNYKFSDLEKVKLNDDFGAVHTFAFLKVKSRANIQAFKEIVKEPYLSLYSITKNFESNGGGMQFNYFLKKGDGQVELFISSDPFWRSLKRTASKYFKDCPSLVNKIKKKEYRKADMIAVVKYYNEQCQ